MTDYFKCTDCGEIRADGKREFVSIPGKPLVKRPRCPVCHCLNMRELDKKTQRVCDHCERALAAEKDDYCEPCRDELDEKVFDLEAAALLAEEFPCPIYGNHLFDIANGRSEAA